ncbi:MAG: nucleotidyltransferase family protein [Flavobacteriaceae bacterium]|nr:nucleotidyltransferase family protein [Flavobacteriaceae bacterium]
MQNLAILILAAGKSSRMNSVKQLLKVNDTNLLNLAIENAVNSKAKKTYCVLGANSNRIKEYISSKNVYLINNPSFEKGLSTSIVKGLEYITKVDKNIEYVLIMLADQPEVDNLLLNKLIDLSLNYKTKIIATSYQEKVGVPAIFPKNYFTELLKLQGDSGAKKLITKDLTNTKVLNLKTSLIDIDTQEDYLNYLKKSKE